MEDHSKLKYDLIQRLN